MMKEHKLYIKVLKIWRIIVSKFDGKEHEVFKIHESDYLDHNLEHSFTCFTMVLSYLLIKIFPF